jgi:hypothetical protein
MLNRVEEIGRIDLDAHGRFPAKSSHAFRYGYLERPIVDEWLHILGQVIQRNWPGIELKQHAFSMKVSHDVDEPSLYAFKSYRTIGRMMAGHLFKRHDVQAFFTAPYVRLATKDVLHKLDPYNTFEWLMDVSDANNLKSAFYFICGGNHSYDADYNPENPIIRNLMRRIHTRGHEIGLHPSYGTCEQGELIKLEANCLKRICSEEGIEQKEWGGRMHYLRWEQPSSLKAWSDAGLSYDSTFGYADHPGFRCGTCFEFPAFNPVSQEIQSLRIRPLVMMECSVIDDAYLGLGTTNAAFNMALGLKDVCKRVRGCFTLLWHNSQLTNLNNRNFYEKIVDRNT